MGDPLLIEPITDWTAVVLIVIGKVVIAFVLLLILTMLMIWFERKLVSAMHNRIGPSLAGPWGILQSLADGIKFFFKEDLIPDRADRRVFILAPFLSLVPAFLALFLPPLFLVPLIVATAGMFAWSGVMWWRQSVRRQGAEP